MNRLKVFLLAGGLAFSTSTFAKKDKQVKKETYTPPALKLEASQPKAAAVAKEKLDETKEFHVIDGSDPEREVASDSYKEESTARDPSSNPNKKKTPEVESMPWK